MRRLVVFGLLWTVVVVAVVLLWPSGGPEWACGRPVGGTDDAPYGCLDELARASELIWWTQTVPLLTFMMSGYMVIAALAVRRWRRRS